ncbi:MAG: hypothetical protein M1829_001677 [Trizodia sp. TS-e1964]|nr:MAG: hypothetical protein M1829_001677 [Trizodia sp. TS-e1964]
MAMLSMSRSQPENSLFIPLTGAGKQINLQENESLQSNSLSQSKNMVPAEPEKKYRGPKTSKRVTGTKVNLKVGTLFLPAGIPANIAALYEFESTDDFGAILMTQVPVIHKQLYEIKENGLIIVTSTYSTKEANINTWQEKGKKISIGFAASALDLFELAPSSKWSLRIYSTERSSQSVNHFECKSHLRNDFKLVKQTFIDDPRVTDDVEPGTFFEDPSYYNSLPLEAKKAVAAIQLTGAHPDRPGLCYLLSGRFFATYQIHQTDVDLQAALTLAALSLWYVLPQHPGRGKSNHHIGLLFQGKWNIFQISEDLDRAIRHYRLATEHAAEPDLEKAAWFTDLGVTLNLRHHSEDFEEIEHCYDRSIELSGESPSKAIFLSNKVYLWQDPRPDIEFRRILNNACAGFFAKWDIGGGLLTADAAIESNKLSANLDGTEWSWPFYYRQAQYFLDRHELTRNLEDLVEATLSADNSLLAVEADMAGYGDCKWICGKVRRRWYDEDRTKNILQEAIQIFTEAIQFLPSASFSRQLVLNDLGNAFIEIFRYEAQLKHL